MAVRIDVVARTKCSSGTYAYMRICVKETRSAFFYEPSILRFAFPPPEKASEVPSSPATHTTKPYYYYALRASVIYNCNYV